ncbi:c-type cytochrome [Limimaricola cinnabarinus]|uniref:c-type cytochrome n=1 Tax=Limimaricola cinnabarinus TaxID=1125964 RepID=UPI0039E608E1
MKTLTLTAFTALLGSAAMAQDITGDAAEGEAQFARQCVSCHVIANDAGEVLAGRNGKIGPNLHGVIGRTPGAVEDFRYSDAIIAYGEMDPAEDPTGTAPMSDDIEGMVWGVDNTVAYLQDPTGFLREALDDPRARSKMAYKVRDEQTAHDITAYLVSFSPDFEAGEETGDETGEETGDEAEDGAASGDAATGMETGMETETGDMTTETETETETEADMDAETETETAN